MATTPEAAASISMALESTKQTSADQTGSEEITTGNPGQQITKEMLDAELDKVEDILKIKDLPG